MNEKKNDNESPPQPSARLIIVDDEESMRFYLKRALSRKGFEVEAAARGEDAIQCYEKRPFDVAIVDLKMPGLDGIEVLTRLRSIHPDALIILMTAYGTIRSAVEAMQKGAFDYITKPFEIEELLLLIDRALGRRSCLQESREFQPFRGSQTAYGDLIGQSPAMLEVFKTIELLRHSNSTVLIKGESGTGKELLARAIHMHSERAKRNFVPINCAALPESLLESELFGHEAGAFTGAVKQKRGLVELAKGGTLFLDEIGEVSMSAQAKLLRFLQERKITPLGAVNEISIDLRFITATSRDLEKMVEESRFRRDLYWRLNVVPIHLPPLRERREDIPLLASYFLERFRKSGKVAIKGITMNAMVLLTSYPWPGNVRELENTIQRMAILHSTKEMLDVDDLPQVIRDNTGLRDQDVRGENLMSYPEAMGAFERGYLTHLFKQTKGNVSQTARILGISRQALHNKIKQLKLDLDRFRSQSFREPKFPE